MSAILAAERKSVVPLYHGCALHHACWLTLFGMKSQLCPFTLVLLSAGDGAEEQRCAEQRRWPFVKVNLQSKPDATAKVVDRTLAAFPSEGGLLTNMQAEHLTSLWS